MHLAFSFGESFITRAKGVGNGKQWIDRLQIHINVQSRRVNRRHKLPHSGKRRGVDVHDLTLAVQVAPGLPRAGLPADSGQQLSASKTRTQRSPLAASIRAPISPPAEKRIASACRPRPVRLRCTTPLGCFSLVMASTRGSTNQSCPTVARTRFPRFHEPWCSTRCVAGCNIQFLQRLRLRPRTEHQQVNTDHIHPILRQTCFHFVAQRTKVHGPPTTLLPRCGCETRLQFRPRSSTQGFCLGLMASRGRRPPPGRSTTKAGRLQRRYCRRISASIKDHPPSHRRCRPRSSPRRVKLRSYFLPRSSVQS